MKGLRPLFGFGTLFPEGSYVILGKYIKITCYGIEIDSFNYTNPYFVEKKL